MRAILTRIRNPKKRPHFPPTERQSLRAHTEINCYKDDADKLLFISLQGLSRSCLNTSQGLLWLRQSRISCSNTNEGGFMSKQNLTRSHRRRGREWPKIVDSSMPDVRINLVRSVRSNDMPRNPSPWPGGSRRSGCRDCDLGRAH